jgi:hypothetical protein
VNIELILKTLDAVISGKDIRENDPLSIEGAS